MAEPNATANGFLATLAAVAAAISPALARWVSPSTAELVVIVVGAFGGAFLSVTDSDTPAGRGALGIAARGFVMALVFTGSVAWLLVEYGPPKLQESWHAVLLAIAAGIAWKQERVFKLAAEWREGRSSVTKKGKR